MNKKIALKDLCIVDEWGKYGIPASAEEYTIDKTRYLRITDISEDGELLNIDKKSVSAPDIDKYLLQEGDIVFARTGNSTGKSYYHEDKNGKLAFAGFLIKYSLDKTKVNPKYVKFFTITNEYKNWVKNLSVGSTRGNINAQTFGDCPISVPERNQQDLLVRTLSLIIEKIELNNRINAELEAMAKTLYDYWFVQFDFPFDFAQGKPDKNGKPYKSSGGKMVWNEELKREIPEGWEVGTLLDIANYENGLPCQKYRPTGADFYRVIKIREMNEGFSSNTEFVRTDIPEKAIIENGDILFSWSASLDVKIWTSGKGALNQHIFKVTSNNYPKSFYFYQLINYLQHFKMMAENRKTTMGHITQEHLKQSRIVIPPKQFTIDLEKIIAPLFSKKVINEIENQRLTELRDWLLPMLMNGQVKVKGDL
jgi:type I restriction enzyme S subunit